MRRISHSLGAGLLLIAATGAPAEPGSTGNESWPAVAGTHPRLWLDPARIARLQGYARRGTERWQRVKARADALLESDSAEMEADALPVLGLAYQATGNEGYCRRAGELLRKLAVAGNDLSRDHYYDYRFVLRDVAAGYDWCHGVLTQTDRERIARWLMDRADQVWPETNPSRATGWAVDLPANNYFWGFLMAWPAALAAYGEDTGRHPVSGTDRPAYHLRLALRKWRTMARPMLDSWGRGGVFPESTNYDAMSSLARLLDAHRTATGRNLATEPGFDFVRDSLLWRIHATTPSLDHVYPLGDQPRVSLAELSAYDRQRVLPLRGLLPDATLNAWAQHWLKTITPPITDWAWVVAWEFLDYDEDAPAEDYTARLPPTYFAPGPGLLVHRSAWREDATYFGIWAGPLRESHQSREANGFKIWKGGWLAGDASIWSHSGILGETRFHNNITVDGREQTWVEPSAAAPEDAAKVVAEEATADYVYFAGQAARAYRPRPEAVPAVGDYLRRLVYLPSQDAFVIQDRVAPVADPGRIARRLYQLADTLRRWAGLPMQEAYAAPNPEAPVQVPAAIEWHLHSQDRIAIEGRAWRFGNGRYTLHGQSLLPAARTSVAAVRVNEGPDNAPSSYRLDVVSNTGRSPEVLLNVLRLRPIDAPAPPPLASLADSTGEMAGTALGEWLVLIARADAAERTVRWTVPAGVTRHLLVGLKPAWRYRVAALDGAGRTSHTWEATSTGAGVLRLDSKAGDAALALEPAAPADAPENR